MSRRSKKKVPAALSTAPASSASEMPGMADSRPPESEGRPAGLNDRWTVPGICIFLAAIALAVFGRTFHYGFINFDDDQYVYENAEVAGGLTLKGVAAMFTHVRCHFYHPLTMLSLMLDYQLHGLHAGGYHLTNVLIHTASAVLLFLILRRMTGALWRSAFVAAVFAIHPLRVESVAWVAERKDVLSGFFFMLTLWAYARYVEKSKVQSPKFRVWYGLMLLSFTLGLLSKPTLVTVPFVLLLLDYWPLDRFGLSTLNSDESRAGPQLSTKRALWLVLEKIPLFALSAAASVMTVMAEGAAVVPTKGLSLVDRIGNSIMSYVTYLRQMVYPADLVPFYPFPVGDMFGWKIILALVLLVAISAVAIAGWRKRPYLLVGWLWYLGMLVPMIGIMQIGGFAHADRFTYLPMIGLSVALTWAAADLCAGWHHRRVVLGGCATIILVALIFRAHAQTAYWRNGESLWTHTLACTSDNFIGHYALGNALLKKGSVDEAIAHYQKALQINPNDANACYSLGNALLQNGNVDEAIIQYQRALRIKPDYAEAYINLGNALLQKGNVDEAIIQYQMALQIKPDNEEAHINLGNALLKKGNVDEAIIQYQIALQIKPDYAEAHNSLGNALRKKGNVDEAIVHYQKALQIKPNSAEACYNLGNTLIQKGNVDEAIVHYQKALQIKPDYAEACYNLGSALLKKGSVDEASAHFQKAIEIKPDYAEAYYNLGVVLDRQGKPGEAIDHYQKALEIKPDYAEAHNNLGILLTKQGRTAEAIEHYRRAIELNPNRAEFYNNLGNLLTLQSHLAEAISNYQKAVEINPDFAAAHFNLGSVLVLRGRYTEAIGHFRKALELKPDDAKARQSLDAALGLLNQFPRETGNRPNP